MRTSSIKLPSAQFIEGFYPDAAGRAAELRDPNVGKWRDIVPLILVCNFEVMNKFAFGVDCALVFPWPKLSRKPPCFPLLPVVAPLTCVYQEALPLLLR